MIHIFYDLNERRKDLTKNYNPENKDEFYHLIKNDTYFHRLICKQVIQCFSDYYEQASKKQTKVREVFIKDQIYLINYLLNHYKVKSEVLINGRSNTMISDLKLTRQYWTNAQKNVLSMSSLKLKADFEQQFADIIYEFEFFYNNSFHISLESIKGIRKLRSKPPLKDELDKNNFHHKIIYSKEISFDQWLHFEDASRANSYKETLGKVSNVIDSYQENFDDANELVNFIGKVIWYIKKFESQERFGRTKEALKKIAIELEYKESKLNGSKNIQFKDFFNEEYKDKSHEVLEKFSNNPITNKRVAFIIHILVRLDIIVIEREILSRLKFTEFLKGKTIKNNQGVNYYFDSKYINALRKDRGFYYNDYKDMENKLKNIFNID